MKNEDYSLVNSSLASPVFNPVKPKLEPFTIHQNERIHTLLTSGERWKPELQFLQENRRCRKEMEGGT